MRRIELSCVVYWNRGKNVFTKGVWNSVALTSKIGWKENEHALLSDNHEQSKNKLTIMALWKDLKQKVGRSSKKRGEYFGS